MSIPISRRLLLRSSVSLSLGALALGMRAQAAAGASTASELLAQRLSACHPSGDPLAALLAGNGRFAAAWQATGGNLDPRFAALWRHKCQPDPEALAQGQRPWAAVLTCADSRVAPEWLFDLGPGELFDVRSAGNTAFRAGIASLEYAVAELAVPLILVLGHSGCGAVQAALGHELLTPLLEELVAPIRAGLQAGDDLTQAVQANVRRVVDELGQRSDLIRLAVADGRLQIVGAYADIGSGRVSLLT